MPTDPVKHLLNLAADMKPGDVPLQQLRETKRPRLSLLWMPCTETLLRPTLICVSRSTLPCHSNTSCDDGLRELLTG